LSRREYKVPNLVAFNQFGFYNSRPLLLIERHQYPPMLPYLGQQLGVRRFAAKIIAVTFEAYAIAV
jgi:hypothetical protein